MEHGASYASLWKKDDPLQLPSVETCRLRGSSLCWEKKEKTPARVNSSAQFPITPFSGVPAPTFKQRHPSRSNSNSSDCWKQNCQICNHFAKREGATNPFPRCCWNYMLPPTHCLIVFLRWVVLLRRCCASLQTTTVNISCQSCC